MILVCDDVRPRAAGLAALPEDDAERRAAFDHATGCGDCARALAQGTKLQDLLLQARPLEAPSPESLARAAREIERELAAEPAADRAARARTRSSAWPLGAGVVLAFAVVAAMARHRAGDGRSLAAAGALAGAAVLLIALAPRRHPLLVGLIAAASLIFALMAGQGGGLAPAIGVHCVLAELLASAFPLAIALGLVKRRQEASSFLFFGTVAAAGALAGHAALHLTCPVRFEGPHLFVFHTGGVVLAACLGFLAARLAPLLGWAAVMLALAGCGPKPAPDAARAPMMHSDDSKALGQPCADRMLAMPSSSESTFGPLEVGADYANYRKVSTQPFLSRTHGGRFVEVYVNDVGYQAYTHDEPFPMGTVIVKISWENVDGRPTATAGPIFTMKKEAAGYLPDHEDWNYGIHWEKPTEAQLRFLRGPIYWRGKSPRIEYCWKCHDNYDRSIGGVPAGERAWESP